MSNHNSIRDIQQTHLETYRSNPDRIGSDAGTERQDRADYDGRFIFELLQNAVDEMAGIRDPEIQLELTRDSLLVANNGAEFTLADLYALTLTTRTTKAGETSIGHKGRGFTSVLGITDRPAVYSDTVQARFDREETAKLLNDSAKIQDSFDEALIASDVPVLGIPVTSTPSERVQELLNEGFTTVFEFPLREPDRLFRSINRKLEALDANTIALLPALNRIEIECPEWERTWVVSREQMRHYEAATLVHIENETTGVTHPFDKRSYLVFETESVDREPIIARSNLTEVEVETMGDLTVGIGFRAKSVSDNAEPVPSDWRVAPVYGQSEEQPPYVHVFLPTQERSPIPALITGTFQSDTSRRNLTLDYNDELGYEGQFNSLLFEELGALIADTVIPFVQASETSVRMFLSTLDPSLGGERDGSFVTGSIEDCLFTTLTDQLSDIPFIPSGSGNNEYSITDIVIPHTAADSPDLGKKYATIVGREKIEIGSVSGILPANSLLDHRTAMTLRLLGSQSLSPTSAPTTIAASAEETPLLERSSKTSDENESEQICRLFVDPVLVLLVEIRKTLKSDDERDSFDEACRAARVFPITTVGGEDGTQYAKRAESGSQPFFIPPEDPIGNESLPTLSFLPRELYHGTNPEMASKLREEVLPTDFRSEVENIWQIEPFSFERVFDAAIRPWIPGPNSQDVDTDPLESHATLSTICKMAAVQSPENDRNPESPLLYRSSRRSFFELSKLPVPARNLNATEIQWVPAHRVYVGKEWQQALGRSDHAQIQPLLEDVGDRVDTNRYEPWILATPSWFDLERDDTEQLEDWIAFFRWLGVAEHVRPLPLFAPDAATRHRYRKTKGVSQPPRSGITASSDLAASDETSTPVDARYAGLSDDEWETYRDQLLTHLESQIETPDHRYLFQVNPLEYAEEILSAAEAEEAIGNRLLNHLAAWWESGLATHEKATAAEFTNNRWRGSNRSYFFRSSELCAAGPNLWIWQLQQQEWVPTSFGSVSPPDAWYVPAADRERFSLQVGRSHALLPFVTGFEESPTDNESQQKHLAAALDIGLELDQGTVEPADVSHFLTRIAHLLGDQETNLARFAGEVELLYTRIAELLPGLAGETIANRAWHPEQTGLADVAVLCRIDDTYEFKQANEAYFVRSHSARERYNNLGLPQIVLFKPEAPRFGLHIGSTDTQSVVTKTPLPGDDLGLPVTVAGQQVDEAWFQMVFAALLLRLRADRPSAAAVDQDTRNTRQFLTQLEVVDGLELELKTQEQAARYASDTRPRPYYIERDGQEKSRVYLDGTLTESDFIDAVARAYTDYLDVPQYYEGVYNLLDHAFGAANPQSNLIARLRVTGSGARPAQLEATRERLFTDESVRDRTATVPSEPADGTADKPEPDPQRDPKDEENVATNGAGSASHSNRVPDLDSLTRIGDREVFQPDTSMANDGTDHQRTTNRTNTNGTGGGSTPASQEYRSKIDNFGMTVTIESEIDRLEQDGETNPERKVWDVSTPQTFQTAKDDSELVKRALERFANDAALDGHSDPFDTDWPGFDVLTIVTDTDGEPQIDRCIELKTSGLRTRKPSLSWNEWKAAGSVLSDRYYLYVVRNIRSGKSGDATLLEIPRPFQTLTEQRKERREREVQLDLRSFDIDSETIVERGIEWKE